LNATGDASILCRRVACVTFSSRPWRNLFARRFKIEDVSNEATTISLRPVTLEDEPFLFEVYADTRRDEMAQWGWDRAQQDMFLKMQFKAQHQSYELEDEETETKIILLEGKPVGRLIVNRTESEIRLTDIALLSEYRSGGIGTILIKDLFDEASRMGLPVRLHVLKNNRAIRLYERLGFKTTGESGMHFQMEWIPGTRPDRT
jgi:ribosomal protein S18 acetylase RimI-like enzyme